MVSSPVNIPHDFFTEQGSFRDETGFIFYKDSQVFRAIRRDKASDYSLLMKSGLYKELVSTQCLISHEPSTNSRFAQGALSDYIVISPKKVPFISYPYEWSFQQLKVAALLTLRIQKIALRSGMTLKDSSAYNVQFLGTRPVFIDTLSFEKYEVGKPWIAYRQFCQHFLAPLAIMHYKKHNLSRFLQLHIDGIPLDIASSVLPRRSYFQSALAAHIHVHAKIQGRHATNQWKKNNTEPVLSKSKLLLMIDHLESGIKNLESGKKLSLWSNYEKEHNYSNNAIAMKAELIDQWAKKIKPEFTWDCGCNTGKFSEIAAKYSCYTIGLDSDANCIDFFFGQAKKKDVHNILPLVFDFNNPTPSIGWANSERKTISERGTADLILALAVIHHFRIANNVPWNYIAQLFKKWINPQGWLIVEFIEKEDSQVQRLLSSRKDIFADYDLSSFLASFSAYFDVVEKTQLPESRRWLCLMKSKA